MDKETGLTAEMLQLAIESLKALCPYGYPQKSIDCAANSCKECWFEHLKREASK